MEEARKSALLGVGALAAAVTASLCCILPIVVAVAGVGSAALGARFEPLRPFFAALTAALLGYGFYRAYRRRECAPGETCPPAETRRGFRIVLWIVTGLAILLLTFPYYSGWLF